MIIPTWKWMDCNILVDNLSVLYNCVNLTVQSLTRTTINFWLLIKYPIQGIHLTKLLPHDSHTFQMRIILLHGDLTDTIEQGFSTFWNLTLTSDC